MFPIPLFEKIVLSPLNGFGILVKNNLTMYVRFHCWTLCSVLYDISVFMLVAHCYDYCSFVLSFEIRKCKIDPGETHPLGRCQQHTEALRTFRKSCVTFAQYLSCPVDPGLEEAPGVSPLIIQLRNRGPESGQHVPEVLQLVHGRGLTR